MKEQADGTGIYNKKGLNRAHLALLIGAFLFLIWPTISAYTPLSTYLLAEIVVFGLFAMSYNLALGYTGLISFGHAAYFGLGAYTMAICLTFFNFPMILSMICGVLVSAAAGLVVGFLVIRRSGAYFAIITLAVSMVFYYIAATWIGVTGGHEGITGLPVMGFLGIPLNTIIKKYYFILFAAMACIYIQWRLIGSPFGRVLEAIRENERRARTCGYDTYWIKLWSFVISAAFSALAGCLFTLLFEICDTSLLYWTMSGTVLVITLFGGQGTFMGPFVGALVFLVMKDKMSLYIEHWEVLTGVLFIAIVLLLPKGILGTIMSAVKLTSEKAQAAKAEKIADTMPSLNQFEKSRS